MDKASVAANATDGASYIWVNLGGQTRAALADSLADALCVRQVGSPAQYSQPGSLEFGLLQATIHSDLYLLKSDTANNLVQASHFNS